VSCAKIKKEKLHRTIGRLYGSGAFTGQGISITSLVILTSRFFVPFWTSGYFG
jgi:hypothetical protein